MSCPVPIIIEEYAGIDRTNEPVTVGIPFPMGLLTDISKLSLFDSEKGYLPLQAQVLAQWPDGSLKWVLLDFQASVNANMIKKLGLSAPSSLRGSNDHSNIPSPLMGEGKGEGESYISFNQHQNYINIDTKAASYFINTNVFKPFDRVVIDSNEILNSTKSKIVLTDEKGAEYEPLINKIFYETKGSLRTTLKVEGKFKSSNKSAFATFFSRINFYANSSMVKIEFTILNSKPAKHPGGLWDLGDPGSIFFKDLSLYLSLDHELSTISYQLRDELSAMSHELNHELSANDYQLRAMSYELSAINNELIIYQDSSGGENWKSLSHINRNEEVKNSFRGNRVYEDGKVIHEGLRANPIVTLKDKDRGIAATVRHFWQNFPKAIEVKGNSLIIKLFPKYYDDVFELQGGEQKTHTVYINFESKVGDQSGLEWTQNPLIPRSTPEWYAQSQAIPYLLPESLENQFPKDTTPLNRQKQPLHIPSPSTGEGQGEGDINLNNAISEIINSAIKGNNTFFHRRELIDEYGWRNFGEFYADHEAVGYKEVEPLISHYNNQYDCIYGSLIQYLKSGEFRWFILANELCSHVKDIDIYHTDDDRPEYNHGMFWHTDHYIDAKTATHRCFSKMHAEYRNMAEYGGGPSLSHNYATGMLLHYYLTGDYSSLEAVIELASFVENNIDNENTISSRIVNGIKRMKSSVNGRKKLVQTNKVYGLDGPGRASGNSLNTLLDAYVLTDASRYLKRADDLILRCIHPADDIKKRDLLDTENRWMYTVFLQAVGKYLDIKTEREQIDYMWQYARESLVNYAKWMVENEYPFLSKPEKLKYPNETWAAQDIRKCNVLLYAAKYSSEPLERDSFIKKAEYFYKEGLNYLLKFETKTLTRPIALMMLNGMMYGYFKYHETTILQKDIGDNESGLLSPVFNSPLDKGGYKGVKKATGLTNFSLKREIQYLKWRIFTK